MQKCTWYYGKLGKNDFARDAENMARCGLQSLIADASDAPTLEALSRAVEGKGIGIHLFCSIESLYRAATGRPCPEAVQAHPEIYSAMFKPGQKVYPLHCFSSLKDSAPLAQYAENLAGTYPAVKGINLDQIRYPNTAMQERNPCQCAACGERRRPWLRHDALTDEDMKDPAVMYKEIETKVEAITGIVRAMSEMTRRRRLTLSICGRAIYAWRDVEFNAPPTWGYGPAIYEGQDWVRWAREKLVDVIHFMNYAPKFERFERLARQHADLVGRSGIVLHEGIAVASSAGGAAPEVFEQEIALTRELGLHGVTIFPWLYMTEEHMKILEKA
jgi:hypothetical protein